jgi:hypothetical protein
VALSEETVGLSLCRTSFSDTQTRGIDNEPGHFVVVPSDLKVQIRESWGSDGKERCLVLIFAVHPGR